jgi:hypothetical protein
MHFFHDVSVCFLLEPWERLSIRGNCAWWFTSIIPAIQEAYVGGLRSEASLGMRAYLKNN